MPTDPRLPKERGGQGRAIGPPGPGPRGAPGPGPGPRAPGAQGPGPGAQGLGPFAKRCRGSVAKEFELKAQRKREEEQRLLDEEAETRRALAVALMEVCAGADSAREREREAASSTSK